jgi:hypothetical protein
VPHALTDWLLHLDTHLAALAAAHGALVYAVMFGFIFVETGVVILPFLPGDSLLFVAGALAATGTFSLPVLAPALVAAAIAGDTLNFAIGGAMRKHVLAAGRIRFVKPDYLERRAHSSTGTDARPSCWRASCRSCARWRPSWRRSARCLIEASSRTTSPAAWRGSASCSGQAMLSVTCHGSAST